MRWIGHAAVAVIGLALAAGGCGRRTPARELDLDLIRVSGDARLRTDVVGEDRFAATSAFVLVDAENTAAEPAYVTLGGKLTDATGAVVGALKPQSLYIPPRESRTFALVDTERKPRPAATSARIDELHTFVDQDRIVVQAYLINDADRIGQIMVIAAFHDADNRPMTRPFDLVTIEARSRTPVQFVGPPRSKRGTIFLGDLVY